MSRSINGDNGNTGGVAMTVLDQTQNTDYVFDGELVLYEQQFAEPVTVKVDINLLYSWINCTRASRFYLPYMLEMRLLCAEWVTVCSI